MGALGSLLGSLFILASSLNASSQTLPPRITTFGQEDFKAHHQVFCAQQLPDGRTAFGVIGKVLLYNGEGFEHVAVSSGKAVFSMASTPNGKLFIGGRSLIGVVTPDSNGTMRFRSLTSLLPDSLDEVGIVWRTLRGSDGKIYFASAEHLFIYDKERIKVLRPEQRFGLAFTPEGHPVITGVDNGLFRIERGRKEKLPASKSLLKDRRIMAVLPSAGEPGTEWTVFTEAQGIFSYDPSDGEHAPFPDNGANEDLKGLYRSRIYTACRLAPEKNSYGAAYAVGTRRGGVYFLDEEGRPLLQLSSEQGLPADLVWKLSPAGRGNLWAATNDGIALLQIGRPFTVAMKGNGFEGGIKDIDRPERPADSPLYLATSQGVWEWSKAKSSFSLLKGTAGQNWDLLSYTPDGRKTRMLIAGGRDNLLSARIGSGNEKSRERVKRLSIGNGIMTLTRLPYPSDGGSVLMGGRPGLKLYTLSNVDRKAARKELFSIQNIPKINQAVEWDTSSTEPDSIRIWAGTASKGVISVTTDTAFTGHRVVHYDTAHGLPEGEILPLPDPSSKGADVRFGTDKGLYAFEAGSFRPDPTYGKIFSDGSRQVFQLKKGVQGVVWIDDAKGGQVKRLLPKGDASYRIDSTVFRSLDLGALRCIHPEEERTWFGGDRGLAAYFPEVSADLNEEWHCLFREVIGSGDSLLFDGTFSKKVGSKQLAVGNTRLDRVPVKEQPEGMIPSLPYSENRMEFAFAAPFPVRQAAVSYSYKLHGFDTAWSKWTKEPKKEYTNLPEGPYSFRVRAKNIYGGTSSTASYRFRILPPWYRTWTAYGGYSMLGVGFVWLLLRLNGRRLEVQKERLERTVRERTQEIREQKQAVEEAHERLSEAHQEITHSIDYAEKIQKALLRSEGPTSTQLPEHFILFKPRDKVSGDFYWIREHKDHLYLAVVDCTGHGVPGAFMSMLGISQLNEIMNTDEVPTPGEILTDLRERVVRELSGSDPESAAKDGMDAAILKIPLEGEVGDPLGEGFNPHREEEGDKDHHHQGHADDDADDKVRIQFAGAQNPLYVIRKGIAEDVDPKGEDLTGRQADLTGLGDPSGLSEHPIQNRLKPFKKSPDGIEIKGDHMPVGYAESADNEFPTVNMELQKGDMLYIFSDGYADQFGGPKGKKFRYGPFKELLASLHENTLEEQKQELDKTFEEWKAESQQEQVDDVCVLGVRL